MIPIYDYFLLWFRKTGSFYARDHETSLGTTFSQFTSCSLVFKKFRLENKTDVTFFDTSAIAVGSALSYMLGYDAIRC
jgi:hypothetical protein